jgi:hypothetical protein
MQRPSFRSKATLWTTSAVFVVAVGMVVAISQFTSDAGAGHATFHLLFALVPALFALAAQWLWRPAPSDRLPRIWFITASWSLAAVQLLESIGAFGYGTDNSSVRFKPLTTLHNTASGATVFALGFFVAALVMALIALVTRMLNLLHRRKSAP